MGHCFTFGGCVLKPYLAAALKLDRKDLKILEALLRDCRISKKKLANAIGLTLTPCAQRLRRLEKAGLIRGYHCVVATEQLGSFVWAHMAVTLARHRDTDFQRFEAAVRAAPEIIECAAVGGGIDYLLKVVARDISHYQQIIDSLLAQDIGMKTYSTYFVTKCAKPSTALPLASLLELP